MAFNHLEHLGRHIRNTETRRSVQEGVPARPCHGLNKIPVVHHNSSSQHILIDTGAPKTICSENGITTARWKPMQNVSLPCNTKPVRFDGTDVMATSAAFLAAKVSDISETPFTLQKVVFILPLLPIHFLVGLATPL